MLLRCDRLRLSSCRGSGSLCAYGSSFSRLVSSFLSAPPRSPPGCRFVRRSLSLSKPILGGGGCIRSPRAFRALQALLRAVVALVLGLPALHPRRIVSFGRCPGRCLLSGAHHARADLLRARLPGVVLTLESAPLTNGEDSGIRRTHVTPWRRIGRTPRRC